MLPLPTTTVTLRPAVEDLDPYETASTPAASATGVPAHIASPSGQGTRSREQIDAEVYIDSSPAVTPATIVVDEQTEQQWRVTWVEQRQGLGLDHQVAGLVRVRGAGG